MVLRDDMDAVMWRGLLGRTGKFESGDDRGREVGADEARAIERRYGLERGCTLESGGARWFYWRVGTLGEELGEKPCVWAYKYRDSGSTAAKLTLLNVWRVER